MKQIVIIITGMLAVSAIQASNLDAPTTHIGECLQWENVCKKTSNCTQRSLAENNGCYRCVKTVETNSSSLNSIGKTVDACASSDIAYLQHRGYSCRQKYSSGKCLYSTKQQTCTLECTKRAAPPTPAPENNP